MSYYIILTICGITSLGFQLLFYDISPETLLCNRKYAVGIGCLIYKSQPRCHYSSDRHHLIAMNIMVTIVNNAVWPDGGYVEAVSSQFICSVE